MSEPTLADRIEAMCRTAGHCNRPPCDLADEVRALEKSLTVLSMTNRFGVSAFWQQHDRAEAAAARIAALEAKVGEGHALHCHCDAHVGLGLSDRCIEWRKP